MSARISLAQLLDAIGHTYRTIDVRVAAILEEKVWTNALAVIRLSRMSPEALRNYQLHLEQKHGSADTKHFQIILEALPFSEWQKMVDGCSEGILRIGNNEVRLSEKLSLISQSATISRFQNDLRSPEKWNWPAFEVWFGRDRPARLAQDDLVRELGEHGWSSPFQAINALAELNVWQGGPYVADFFLSAPVFLFISNVQISTAEKRLNIKLAQHSAISKRTVVAAFNEQNINRAELLIKRAPIQLESIAQEDEITVFGGSADVPSTLSLENTVEVKAGLPGLGETDSLKRTARDLIPETERNVLLGALRYVCPDEQLEELLVRPYEHQPKRLKESAAFELHVAWLLGLFGFSTIVLGEYERILARTTPVERASVDILAARGNSLAVVACTINAPKSVDFDTLLQAREILAREVFAGTSVQIGTMLFTGAVGYDSFKELGDGYGAIPIIDVDRLAIALELLKAGLEERFFLFLASPMLSPLRSPSEEVY